MAEDTSFHKTFDEWMEEFRNRPRRQKVYDWLRHRLPHIIRYELTPIKRIKWFWQRGRRGWSDRDAWSIDYYLPDVMIGLLDRFMEGGVIGYVATLKNGTDEENEAEWMRILLLIKDGFLAAKDIHDYKYRNTNDAAWQRFNRGMNLFKKYFFGLWD